MEWIRNWLSSEDDNDPLSDDAKMEIDSIAGDIEENLNRVYEGRKRRGFAAETRYDDPQIAVHQRGYETPFCRVGLTTRDGPIEIDYIETDGEPYEADFPPFEEAVGAVETTLMVASAVRERSPDDLPESYTPKQG